MKAELVTKEEPKTSKPVTFQVTCENQEELDFWATIFNHSYIERAAKEFGVKPKTLGGYYVPPNDFLINAAATANIAKLSDLLNLCK